MEKRIVIGLLLTLVIIVFVPVYWVREPGRQEAAVHRQQEEALERGADTYVTLCVNCHGPQGQGLIGPTLKGTKLEKDPLVRVISRGRPTDRVPMPAWGTEDGGPLKTHQVADLVRFILNWDEHILEEATLKHEAAVPLPTEPVAQGKQLFISVGCSFCHGGGGEGTNFAPPLGGRTREQIVGQARKPRTPLMPAYTPQHLSDEYLEKLVAFLLTLQPPPTPTPPPAPPGLPPAQAQDIAQGAQLYARLGCVACHGPEGKGTPIAPAAIVGKSPQEIQRQVRTPKGTIMPPFPPAALSDADLEKVIAFIQTLKP